MRPEFDLAVVGGGILGLAAARAWLGANPGRSLVLFEKEARVAAHQTGHNSGVLHSGLYYAPGTEKARNCRRGKAALEAYCSERGIPCERVGKLVGEQDQFPAAEPGPWPGMPAPPAGGRPGPGEDQPLLPEDPREGDPVRRLAAAADEFPRRGSRLPGELRHGPAPSRRPPAPGHRRWPAGPPRGS